MPLVVDSFVMGPFQSNCYVVRRERGAAEAAVIDPGDDPTPLRLELARMGARDRRDPRHAHRRRPHRRRRGARRRHGRRGLGAGRRGRGAARGRDARRHARRAARSRAHRHRRRRDRRSPGSRSRSSTCPGTARGHVAFHADGQLFSGDLLFAGSVGRVDLAGGDWETLLDSVRALLDRFPADTVVHPGPRPGDDARARAADEPVPARAARRARREPRSSRRRAGRTTSCRPTRRGGSVVAHDRGDAAPLRLAAHPDAGLRGHRALRAHVGRGVRRRAQGDVHVRRPQRPLADAAPGGHRADRARVPRARPAPRAAAGEGVHDRADVPLRRARAAAATASTTSCRSRRSAPPTRRSTPR